MDRSSRPELFCKKDVLRNFTKFTENYLCQRLLFRKAAGLRPATLLKKSLCHRCFPVNFAKFLKTRFFTEHLRWLLLIGDSRIVFCPWLLWKHELKLRSSHCSCSTKKVFLGILQISQESTCLKYLFNRVAGQETQEQMFSYGVYEIFKKWSLRTTPSVLQKKTCFVWSFLLNKLHLWLKSVHGLWIIIYSFACQFSLHYFTTIDTAIIGSTCLVVFCKKGVLTNFAKFTRKHLH